MKCCNWGRDRGYLRFAFALTGPPGLLIRCPFSRLGDKKNNNKKNRDHKKGEKQSTEAVRYHRTVMQWLTVANTVGTHKKMLEKTLTSLLFVYCVNMATCLPAKSLYARVVGKAPSEAVKGLRTALACKWISLHLFLCSPSPSLRKSTHAHTRTHTHTSTDKFCSHWWLCLGLNYGCR